MNILAEFLPGARQVRTPLAIGYLWLLVAWINAPRVPRQFQHGTIILRANKDIRHLTPTVAMLIISFLAYLIGLFFEILDEITLKVATFGLAVGVFGITLLAAIVLAFGTWPITAPLACIAIGLLVFRARRYHASIQATTQQLATNLFLPVRSFGYSISNIAWKAWSAARPVKNDLVADKTVQLLDDHPDLTERFCSTLSIPALRAACMEAGLKTGRAKALLGPTDNQLTNVTKAAVRSSIDPKSEKVLREYLRTRLGASREVRRSVILRVMNTSDVRSLVNRALDDVAARIQANKPSVFETYDRIRSEGEFRRGVAVPLGAALCSVCSIYTNSPWSIMAAGAPLLLVYFSGMRKQEEAAKIAVSWINAGIADINLDIKDSRLLRWPTKNPTEPSILSRLRSFVLVKRASSTPAVPEPDLSAEVISTGTAELTESP